MRTNKQNVEHVTEWRKRTKQRIVDSFGGKCGICNYNRCNVVLELHHLIPSEKEYTISHLIGNPTSWEKIVMELRKCVMLCSNCHKEYHAGIIEIPKQINLFNEEYANFNKQKTIDTNPCPICGTIKPSFRITCSLKCAAHKSRRFNWDKIDLVDMITVKKMTQTNVAKIVGCSGAAVRKRMKRLGLL